MVDGRRPFRAGTEDRSADPDSGGNRAARRPPHAAAKTHGRWRPGGGPSPAAAHDPERAAK
eukprot:5193240-Alexandrium_andersonii.AAC.1